MNSGVPDEERRVRDRKPGEQLRQQPDWPRHVPPVAAERATASVQQRGGLELDPDERRRQLLQRRPPAQHRQVPGLCLPSVLGRHHERRFDTLHFFFLIRKFRETTFCNGFWKHLSPHSADGVIRTL